MGALVKSINNFPELICLRPYDLLAHFNRLSEKILVGMHIIS